MSMLSGAVGAYGRRMASKGGTVTVTGPTLAAPDLYSPDENSGTTGSSGGTGGTGTGTITWNAPYCLQNGAESTSYTHHTVYWGTSHGNLGPGGTNTGSATVPFGTLTYTRTGLAPGTWYMCVTASNAYGESYPSFEAIIVVT